MCVSHTIVQCLPWNYVLLLLTQIKSSYPALSVALKTHLWYLLESPKANKSGENISLLCSGPGNQFTKLASCFEVW